MREPRTAYSSIRRRAELYVQPLERLSLLALARSGRDESRGPREDRGGAWPEDEPSCCRPPLSVVSAGVAAPAVAAGRRRARAGGARGGRRSTLPVPESEPLLVPASLFVTTSSGRHCRSMAS